MKKRVYVLGNPIVKKDCLPIKILPELKRVLPKIQFMHIDPTEEYQYGEIKDIILIDTVIGIHEVTCFTGLNQWSRSSRVTVHNFDLPLSLGLLQKLGKIDSIKIIGVPESGNKKEFISQIVSLLKAI